MAILSGKKVLVGISGGIAAYKLAINSVVWRQKERIENAVSYFNSFKNTYNDSEFLDEMESKISELSEINNI